MALSKSAVDRLGDRLREGTATDADWTLLEELRALRRLHLDGLAETIRSELAVAVTTRIKTNNTLVEKLRRGRMRLSRMDDIAGARILVDGGLLEQDETVGRILSIWPTARVKDRRSEPMHGYRAVHVIPIVDSWPLEIQVRTARQDAVANVLERLADDWGRQIRYGGDPDASRVIPFPTQQPGLDRRDIVEVVQVTADMVAEAEEARRRTERGEQVTEIGVSVEDYEDLVDDQIDYLVRLIEDRDAR